MRIFYYQYEGSSQPNLCRMLMQLEISICVELIVIIGHQKALLRCGSGLFQALLLCGINIHWYSLVYDSPFFPVDCTKICREKINSNCRLEKQSFPNQKLITKTALNWDPTISFEADLVPFTRHQRQVSLVSTRLTRLYKPLSAGQTWLLSLIQAYHHVSIFGLCTKANSFF